MKKILVFSAAILFMFSAAGICDDKTEDIADKILKAYDSKNYTAMYKYADKTVKNNPEDSFAYFMRAEAQCLLCSIKKKNCDYLKAIDDYTKALIYDKRTNKAETASMYAARAEARKYIGDYVGGADDYTVAIYYNGAEKAEYYSARAYMYFKNDEYKKAIKDASRAIKKDPTEADNYALRGKAEIYYAMDNNKCSSCFGFKNNCESAKKDFIFAKELYLLRGDTQSYRQSSIFYNNVKIIQNDIEQPNLSKKSEN